MPAQNIFSALNNVPSIAIMLFFVLGAILAVELWYLRPKRKLPLIPPPEETQPQPTPPPGFRPLSQKQIFTIGFLLMLLVVIPLAVYLFKQTQEAKRVTLVPSPTPTLHPTPTRTPTPLPTPTFTPFPGMIATPSATPSSTPTATPTAKPKIGALSPSPSPTETPKVEKPKELPDASVSEQLALLSFLSLSAFSLGLVTFKIGRR